MSDTPDKRPQEGALSALKTPASPPAAPKLVPLHRSNSRGAKNEQS